MLEDLKAILEEFLLPLTEQMQLELVELELQQRNKTIAVLVLVDKSNGGINVDGCTAINKAVALKIETDLLIPGDYVIEVSSPGLDRSLKRKNDFVRIVGRPVRFFLNEMIGNKLEHVGNVVEVLDDKVKIDVKNIIIEIPFEKINKAKQELMF